MTGIIWPGVAGGGGYVPSSADRWGPFRPLAAGMAGGGGAMPSDGAAPPGLGGCGGPGPGALIGLRP